ncbi:MAG: hypothetical protein IIB71_11385 [Proteobacteria bacterium]|nr:hypothetical protein [Pseudomonadota bacterium]
MSCRIFQTLAITCLVVLISGCASTGNNPAQMIVGSWQSELGGFPLRIEYTKDTVKIGDYNAVAYQIDEGKLILAQEGSQPRMISFPSADEMIQTDSLTGTEHKFIRVK